MSTRIDPAADAGEAVAIVGVGLIGGSIAAALKKRGLAKTVIGIGRNPARLEAARGLGLLDWGTDDIAAGAAAADLIVVCTPVDRIVDDVRAAAKASRAGTVITDAGSVKQSICSALDTPPAKGVEFVGSHPLAGSEKQGYESANAELFAGRVCVLTPTPSTSAAALARVRRFWSALGASVLEMHPGVHDHAVAETSHLPHVAASALAAMLSPEYRALAATGFRDSTRIAAGDPQLWTEILAENSGEVAECVDRYIRTLQAFHSALLNQDEAELKRLLDAGKQSREGL